MLTGTGMVVRPDYNTLYYKAYPTTHPFCTKGNKLYQGECVAIPTGLRMIFGFNMLTMSGGGGYYNCQGPTATQAQQQQGVRIGNIQGATHEDMLSLYCNSKIGVNFSINENDLQKRTQMKLRMFEVPACRALLITQNHKGLEQFFVPGKEVEVFDTEEEMQDKVRFYLKNESSRKAIAEAGWARFMKEHTSRNRLGNLLDSLGV
jgi:spore maturation protein CgeB